MANFHSDFEMKKRQGRRNYSKKVEAKKDFAYQQAVADVVKQSRKAGKALAAPASSEKAAETRLTTKNVSRNRSRSANLSCRRKVVSTSQKDKFLGCKKPISKSQRKEDDDFVVFLRDSDNASSKTFAMTTPMSELSNKKKKALDFWNPNYDENCFVEQGKTIQLKTKKGKKLLNKKPGKQFARESLSDMVDEYLEEAEWSRQEKEVEEQRRMLDFYRIFSKSTARNEMVAELPSYESGDESPYIGLVLDMSRGTDACTQTDFVYEDVWEEYEPNADKIIECFLTELDKNGGCKKEEDMLNQNDEAEDKEEDGFVVLQDEDVVLKPTEDDWFMTMMNVVR